jgi:outer membrane immunogenic protein
MRVTHSLLFGLAAACTIASAAHAQDFPADPIYDSPLFNFEGFYAGAQLGGAALPGPGIVGSVGAVAGANFTLTDAFVAGLEFQGDMLFNGAGYAGLDALLLGHFGGYVGQDLMVYGAAGFGALNGVGSYAFGAGIEAPLMDQVSARGEILGTGTWGVAPNGAKVTGGLLWHMN